jgi:hypothetical protein
MKEIGFRVVLCQDGVVQKVGHTHINCAKSGMGLFKLIID